MSYRRPYYVYDGNFRCVGIEWFDLTDPVANCRVILESELGSAMGPQSQIARGRVTEGEFRRANVDAGVFERGEHPVETHRVVHRPIRQW